MRWSFISILILTSVFCMAQRNSEIIPISTEAFESYLIQEAEPCYAAAQYYENRDSIPDSTFYYLDLAYKLIAACKDQKLKANITIELGKNRMNAGENAIAESYFMEALNGFLSIADKERVAYTHKTIGVNYKRMKRYIDALKAFNTSAYYYHLIKNKKGIAKIELNIGLLHKNMKRYDEAKIKYHSALSLFTEINEQESIADCYNNLGNLFKNENNLDSAMYYMRKTLDSRKAYGPSHKLAYIYHNLANLHMVSDEFDSCAWYLNKSIAIKSVSGNDRDLSSDYFVYGNLYTKQGDFPAAIIAYEKARELGIDDTTPDLDYEVSLELSKSYYAIKDYKKSSQNFSKYFEQLDMLKLSNDPFEIQDELILYEFLKDSVETEKLLIEQELEDVKLKNKQLSNKSIRNQLYFILGIVALLIIMIGLLFYSFRKRLKQARDHRTVLALQNDELKRTLVSKEEKETLLKEIHHRVKNNLQIISSLVRLQSGYINEHNFQERLNEIESRILSMALVHEKLYQSNDLSKLVVKSYIRDLCINILESYQNEIKVKFVFDIDNSKFSIDTLIPLGLILNETISNALKHAFHNKNEGIIYVTLKTVSSNETIMIIKDNGIGANLSLEELKEGSLGMDLITSLTDQLDGDLKIETANEFVYEFSFPNLA